MPSCRDRACRFLFASTPESTSSVEITVPSLRLSIHLSVRGREYKSRIVTEFSFRYSTENRRDSSFLWAKTIRASHSAVGGSMTLSVIIRPTSAAAKSLAVAPSRYGAVWTGLTSSFRRSARLLAKLLRPSCQGHMLSNC